MNSLDAEVIKIISRKPKFEYDKWWVKVEYECYGLHSETYLMFETEKEATDLKIGFKFLT